MVGIIRILLLVQVFIPQAYFTASLTVITMRSPFITFDSSLSARETPGSGSSFDDSPFMN